MNPIRKVFNKPLYKDFTALYLQQLGVFLIPLLTFPVLARSLTPTAWSSLLVAQSIGILVTTIVEYGHNITATRQIAIAQDELAILKISALTHASKSVIVFICFMIALTLLVNGWLPVNLDNTSFILAVLIGVIQGYFPLWFFQGLSKPRISANVSTICKIVSALSMMVVAIITLQPVYVLLTQLIIMSVNYGILRALLKNEITLSIKMKLSIREITEDLKRGLNVFFFRLIASSYTSALAILLSTVVSPTVIALILASDRIAKVAPSLAVPFCQAIFPRIINRYKLDYIGVVQSVLKYAVSVFFVLLSCSFLLFVFRSEIINILTGNKYLEAKEILGYTVWVMPFFGFNTVIFTLWVFPNNKDVMANLLLLINSIISLTWVFFMPLRLPLPFYSFGIYAGEILVGIIFTVILLRHINNLKVGGG